MVPLLPVVLSYILGVLAFERYAVSARLLGALFLFSFLLSVLIYVRRANVSRPVVFALLSLSFFFLGALFYSSVANPVLEGNHIVRLLQSGTGGTGRMAEGVAPVRVDFEAMVVKAPVVSDGAVTVLVEAKRARVEGGWVPVTGLVRLKVRGAPEGLERGNRVRALGALKEPYSFNNPGGYDYRQRLLARSIHVTGTVRHPKLIRKVADGEGGPALRLDRIRAALARFIDRGGYRNPGVMKALVTGDKSGISRGVKEEFAATGTSHLLAISGLHVGTVAFLSYTLALFLLRRSEYLLLALNVKRAAALFSLFPALFYASLAGFPVSTTRAVIMLAVYVLSYLLGRGRQYLNVLAVAALLILVQNPSALFDLSFQLSFAAVAGIVIIAPRLNGMLVPKRPEKEKGATLAQELSVEEGGALKASFLAIAGRGYRWTATALAVSFGATVGTVALVAYHFNTLSTVTLGANLLTVPVTGLAVPLLLAGALLAGVWQWLAALCFLAADYLISLMLFIVKLFASLPFASVSIGAPSLYALFLFYLFVLLVMEYRRGRAYRYGAGVVLLCLLASITYPAVARRYGNELRVTYLSVGQGESALVELPGGKTMLIDGGGFYNTDFDPGRSIVAPLLRRKGIRRIDYMVVSHVQRDHIGGLGYIAENFAVGELWWNAIGRAEGLVKSVREGGGRVVTLGAGAGESGIRAVEIERGGETAFQVFWPALQGSAEGKNGADRNNSSLVLRVRFGAISFLFTGDIEAKGEAGLLGAYDLNSLRSTVLKAPHHASSTSSTPAFISAVSPEVVVVSSGRYNPFGFPHKSALQEYKRAGAVIYRTDMDGAVEVVTDGRGLDVFTYARGGR